MSSLLFLLMAMLLWLYWEIKRADGECPRCGTLVPRGSVCPHCGWKA
nr:MAG TPA: zinc-ribbon containing domain protein [Caudoviricetes sp.]